MKKGGQRRSDNHKRWSFATDFSRIRNLLGKCWRRMKKA